MFSESKKYDEKDTVILSKEYKINKNLYNKLESLEKRLKNLRELTEEYLNYVSVYTEKEIDDIKILIEEEHKILNELIETIYLELFILKHPEYKRNCYLQIKPGAGGDETEDLANLLYQAYLKFFEKENIKYEIILSSITPSGIKNVILKIINPIAYGLLISEHGVHRFIRNSPFNAKNKRHTSFVGVFVTPEVDDIELEISEKDLKIETFRASGAGGQYVNTTEIAVRITHIPTGIVATCQKERSQYMNKKEALRILKSKLYQYMKEQKVKELKDISPPKIDISWGHQVRNYVLDEGYIKDLRTGYKTYDIEGFFKNGKVKEFIYSFLMTSL